MYPSVVTDFDIEDQCENAIEWILALAHSDFPKARGKMKNPKRGMCCLGVGRELNSSGGVCMHYPSSGELPTGLLHEKGLYHTNGSPHVFKPKYNSKNLAPMNDRGVSHPNIAKQILTEPEAYFIPEVAEAVKRYFWLKEDV